MDYTLTMTFITESGDKNNISVSDIKDNLSKEQAIALMDTIINSNVFESSKGTLVSKYAAQVSQRSVTKFEI